MSDHVWYAAYGSNLSRDRFLYYLRGGVLPDTGREHRGSRDPAPPMAETDLRLPRSLYFARESSAWQHGGVAFLDHSEKAPSPTMARAYLLTLGQFEDVLAQENSSNEVMPVDLSEIVKKGQAILHSGWYGLVLACGYRDGHPVLTFTAESDSTRQGLRAPSAVYLRRMASGLRETFDLEDEEIFSYLAGLPGAEGAISPVALREIILGAPE